MNLTVRQAQAFPACLALAAAGIYGYFQWQAPLPENTKELLSAALTMDGIFIGFVATAKSIFLAIDDRKIIAVLKKDGSYIRIVKNAMGAVRWAFLSAGLSTLALVGNCGAHTIIRTIGAASWVACFVMAAATCYRVIRSLSGVLLNP